MHNIQHIGTFSKVQHFKPIFSSTENRFNSDPIQCKQTNSTIFLFDNCIFPIQSFPLKLRNEWTFFDITYSHTFLFALGIWRTFFSFISWMHMNDTKQFFIVRCRCMRFHMYVNGYFPFAYNRFAQFFFALSTWEHFITSRSSTFSRHSVLSAVDAFCTENVRAAREEGGNGKKRSNVFFLLC